MVSLTKIRIVYGRHAALQGERWKYAKTTIVKAPALRVWFFFVKIIVVQLLHSISRKEGAEKTTPNHILKNVKGIRTPLPQVPICNQVRNVNITGTGTGYFVKVCYRNVKGTDFEKGSRTLARFTGILSKKSSRALLKFTDTFWLFTATFLVHGHFFKKIFTGTFFFTGNFFENIHGHFFDVHGEKKTLYSTNTWILEPIFSKKLYYEIKILCMSFITFCMINWKQSYQCRFWNLFGRSHISSQFLNP